MTLGRSNWRRDLLKIVAVGLAAVGTLRVAGAAMVAPDEIALDKVPAKVREAADKAAPKAKWTDASMTRAGAKVTYGLEGKVEGKYAVSIELDADGTVTSEEAQVAIDRVPTKLREAAGKAVPRAKWNGASIAKEGAKVTYHLEGEDASKRYVWVELTADGTVTEEGFEIAMGKVPAVVIDALKKEMPRFKATASYEAKQGGKVRRYDFEGRRPRDQEDITVSVTADGKKVQIEEE